MPRHAGVFVNPVAGGGKWRKAYPTVVRRLLEAGIVCDVRVSQYAGQITEFASELAAQGHETFVACGGDGTVNEVINAIAGTGAALGIVPMGTANDFAVNMGISRHIDVACEIIRQRRVRKIDLVNVDHDKFFAATACLGFDAEVAAFATKRRKKRSNPFVLHVLGGILKFFSYKPRTVELRFNGQKYSGDIFLVAFGNIQSYARGMLITPGAVFDDALVDICIIGGMPKRKVLSIFPSVYKGTHVNYREVTLYRARTVYVQSLGPMDLYADGDFMATTPFRLEVVPKHLNVIVGPSCS